MSLKADSRSDLYALAVCIYEMLSGSAPFSSDNPMGLMYKHVHAEIPQIENQSSSKSLRVLNEFLKKGMNKEPESRFQSAEEMEKAIALLMASDAGEAVENERKDVFRFATPFLLLLTLSALGLVFLINLSRSHGEQATKAAAQISSKSENATDKMQALLRRTDVSAVQKIQNLLVFLQQNGIIGNEQLGVELEKLALSLPAKRRNIGLVKIYYVLAESYMGSSRPLDATQYLEKFFKHCDPDNMEQYRLGIDDC